MKTSISRGRPYSWLPWVIGLTPLLIYLAVFRSIALNANYIAFDDILILGIIPKTENVSWGELWHQLTILFPEHRLVFSRTVVLSLYHSFGRLDLVWLMTIGNLCWIGCVFIFYAAFRKLHISNWYFVPVMWIWLNMQSFENIFWGVSSLCNFGVLLFVLSSFYVAIFYPRQIVLALLLATIATFTYGNGLMVFPVIGLVCFLTGRKIQLLLSVVAEVVIGLIYFTDFKPITDNLDITDRNQLVSGTLGLFGFVGSVATITSYSLDKWKFTVAVLFGVAGVGLIVGLLRNEFVRFWDLLTQKRQYDNKPVLFCLSIAVFIALTVLAVVYKRIPGEGFEGVFKGRYRMYSTLACVCIYFCFLSVCQPSIRRKYFPAILTFTITLNLIILAQNFVFMVNNRRDAITQEFNARYNPDWLGLDMFDMTRNEFEQIRTYYHSADPLAEGWNPSDKSYQIKTQGILSPDSVALHGEYVVVNVGNTMFPAVKNYTDGAYVLLKSANHIYAGPVYQPVVPFKTILRRQMYFGKGGAASFHRATVEPGNYEVFVLLRKNGVNKLYRTDKFWKEN